MNMAESPEYIRTSLAASISLGMEPGQFSRGKGCTCLNILLNYDAGCMARCAYCGLAANRKTYCNRASYIRVRWPVYPLRTILDKLKEGTHPFKRVCVSMVTHPKAANDSCDIIKAFSTETDLPISVLISPTVMNGKDDLKRLKNAGADRAGIAVDAATERLFETLRGKAAGGPHKWDRYLQSVDDAVSVFGEYKTGVHLIVGLGETEKEIVQTIDYFHQKGALTHLFSFYPEQGSLMENHPRPAVGGYRRIQLARYLINESVCDFSSFTFSEKGALVDFGIDIQPFIAIGTPFMTSGCPGSDGFLACNRPYSNERPSEPIRNYHFVPNEEDKKMITTQMFEDLEISV